MRAWQLARDGVPGPESVASVLMDRLLGVASILLSAAVGLALAPDILHSQGVWWVLGVTAAGCLAALALVFSTRIDDLARRLLACLPLGAVRGKGEALLDALGAYRRYHGVLALVLLASVGVQFLRVGQAWLLGQSLGMHAPFISYVAFIPFIVLVMQVPVTINGLGTSQLVFQWCFARVGVPQAEAFALSVLFLALGVVGSLPGGVMYALWPRAAQRT